MYQQNYEDIYQPSQRAVIIYDDGKEDLILQVKYEKGTENFAWVVPVPDYPEVDEADAKLFEELHYLTRPTSKLNKQILPRTFPTYESQLPGVKLWERKKVGIYDVSILSATDPSALIEWLNENEYKFPDEAEEIVDFYIAKDWYFVAMRLEAEEQEAEPWNFVIPADKTFMMRFEAEEQKTQEGQMFSEGIEMIPNKPFSKGTTQPIKLSFNTTQIVYPMKITSLNPGDTEVLLYVFADSEASVEGFSMEYADGFNSKYMKYFNGYPSTMTFYRQIPVIRMAPAESKRYIKEKSVGYVGSDISYRGKVNDRYGVGKFTVEYANGIAPEDVENREALKEVVTKRYFLTKMRKTFSPHEMTNDLFIVTKNSKNNRYSPYSNIKGERIT